MMYTAFTQEGTSFLCLCGHNLGLGITVSELDPDPTVKFFTLSVDGVS